MSNWKDYFTEENLRKGFELYNRYPYVSYKKNKDDYSATVSENGTVYHVKYDREDNTVYNITCTCSSPFCAHASAGLYAIEKIDRDITYGKKNEIIIKNEKKTEKPMEVGYVTLSSYDDGNPHYLSFGSTLSIYKPTVETYNKALRIIGTDKIQVDKISVIKNVTGKALNYSVRVWDEKHNCADVLIKLGQDGIESITCEDGQSKYTISYLTRLCMLNGMNNKGVIELCVHKTAALLSLIQYLQENIDVVDYSDVNAIDFVKNFKREKKTPILIDETPLEFMCDIEPVIEENQFGEWRLILRLQGINGKFYKIQDIEKLKKCIDAKKEFAVSKNNKLDFSHIELTRRAEKTMKFVEQAEIEMLLRTRNSYSSDYLSSEINLIRNLDEFFSIMDGESVIYNNTPLLGFREVDPFFTMKITKLEEKKRIVGITVSGEISGRFYTKLYTYWIENGWLNRTESRKLGSANALLNMADRNGHFSFVVGMKIIDNFYQRVLPELRKYGRVEDEAIEELEDSLKEPPCGVFYLDIENGIITCGATIREDGLETRIQPKVYSSFSRYSTKNTGLEEEMRETLSSLLKGPITYDDKWSVRDDDESQYNFIRFGINALMDVGEVNVSDKVKKIIVKKLNRFNAHFDIDAKDDSLLNLSLDLGDLTIEELVEILESYSKKKRFHRLKSGVFISLEETNLDTLRDLFLTSGLDIKSFTNGKMHIPLYRALYLDQILQSQNGVSYDPGQKFRRMLKDFKSINESDYEVPSSLSSLLRPYQRDAYRWMRVLFDHGFGGILADDMGLGKTIETLTLLLALKEEKKGGPTLIVTPSSLVYNWTRESEKFTPSMITVAVSGTQKEREKIIADYDKYDILITSYDLLKRDIALYEGLTFNIEILDEAQFIKNHNTAQAKAVKAVSAKHRLALTGTPIENRLIELWSIFEFLMPGFLFNQESFKRYISNPIEKTGDKDAALRLKKLTGPFILRRIKSDVLKELPEKIEETRVSRIEGEQKKLYLAEVAKVQGLLSENDDYSKDKIEILAELTRIRQICCDPSLLYPSYEGESAKREATLDLIRSAIDGGHKILLFSQFTSMLALLEEDLKKEGISYYKITGETGKAKRLELVDAFNSDSTPIFLISLKAGGTGLNLTSADIVIHYDPWWNTAVQNQATDRAHRIGQTKRVTVYKMICQDTIEEKIVRLQEAKKNLADEIVSADNISLSSLSKEDLMDLLSISSMT